MIKVFGLVSKKIILICAMISCLCSCGKRKIKIDANNDVFFDKYSYKYVKGETTINQLNIYQKDDYFFYDIDYIIGEDDKYHLLYVFSHTGKGNYYSYDSYYSISNVDADRQYLPDSYDFYVDAKENGKSKIYSTDEIAELIAKYYN